MSRIVRFKEPAEKPFRIVIADPEQGFIAPLHTLLVSELKDAVCVEAITDTLFFRNYLSEDVRTDLLIISQHLLDPVLKDRNISEMYILTDEDPVSLPEWEDAVCIYKYTSPDIILREILSRTASGLALAAGIQDHCRIIVMYSPRGGTGKTLLSLGIARCLYEMRRKVLYLNAQWLQTFQYHLKDQTYTDCLLPGEETAKESSDLYEYFRQQIRTEGFSYLPPFRSSLISLNADLRIYEKLAIGIQQSGEYEYVIVDTDSSFDRYKSSLLTIADRAVIVSGQSEQDLFAVRELEKNLNRSSSEKFLLVCNDFREKEENAFLSTDTSGWIHSPEYIEHIDDLNRMELSEYAQIPGIRRVAGIVS